MAHPLVCCSRTVYRTAALRVNDRRIRNNINSCERLLCNMSLDGFSPEGHVCSYCQGHMWQPRSGGLQPYESCSQDGVLQRDDHVRQDRHAARQVHGAVRRLRSAVADSDAAPELVPDKLHGKRLAVAKHDTDQRDAAADAADPGKVRALKESRHGQADSGNGEPSEFQPSGLPTA